MKQYQGNIANASPRPWRVEHVTRQMTAYVKGADESVVCICHADNAEMIVRAVNDGMAEWIQEKGCK